MEMYGMTGELLGTIGQEVKQKPLAKWKEVMLCKPSISIRKGVARGYAEPYEDTNTLVLTAPSGTFVDIRFPTNFSTPRSDPVFWAFAGVATISFPEASTGLAMPYMAHCVWEHEIDSKEPSNDEGDLYLLGNGDVIEVGVGVSQDKVQMYKEYWTSPEDLGGKREACTVAKTGGNDTISNGIIIRIGRYCQGILWQEGESLCVGRWVNKSAKGDMHWTQDFRSDSESGLPCDWVCQPTRQKGDNLVVGGHEWRITEVYIP